MSYSYYRVIPEPVSNRMYGFETVSAKQANTITQRLQKPTYSSDFIQRQCFQTQASPPAAPPVLCKRASSAGVPLLDQQPASFNTQKDLERAIRRIATPTLSRMAAEGRIAPSYETNFQQPQGEIEITTSDQEKTTQRIRRPTTASHNKSRQPEDEYVIVEYLDKPVVTKEHIQTIVDRVSTPTIASEGGIGPTCPKRRDSIGKRSFVKHMPLISGLERSKSVSEIVNRLYTPPNISVHKVYKKQDSQHMRPPRPKSGTERKIVSPKHKRATVSKQCDTPPNFYVHLTRKNRNGTSETVWGYSGDMASKTMTTEYTKSQSSTKHEQSNSDPQEY